PLRFPVPAGRIPPNRQSQSAHSRGSPQQPDEEPRYSADPADLDHLPGHSVDLPLLPALRAGPHPDLRRVDLAGVASAPSSHQQLLPIAILAADHTTTSSAWTAKTSQEPDLARFPASAASGAGPARGCSTSRNRCRRLTFERTSRTERIQSRERPPAARAA